MRATIELPWLRPSGRRLVIGLFAAEAAAEPRRLEARIAFWRRLRYLAIGVRCLDLIAGEAGTRVVHPLLSSDFWSAVATVAAPVGFAGRTDGVRRLFGDLLPPDIIERTSKASFDHVFWTERSRAFARDWDGSGVSEDLVDARELVRHWSQPNPSTPSSLLLQAAWLGSGANSVEQNAERVLH
jgi:asparagine synthase (glutamine-hydrolysing)